MGYRRIPVPDLEEARKLLERAGYKVRAPNSGVACIVRHIRSGECYPVIESSCWGADFELIAKVQWTEGEGM